MAVAATFASRPLRIASSVVYFAAVWPKVQLPFAAPVELVSRIMPGGAPGCMRPYSTRWT
jgi:hypothetical protein